MLTILEAIILGIVQGVTEWLPISSSGHLVLVQHLLGQTIPVSYDVILHLGTLLVLFIYFRKDIWELISGIIKMQKKYLKQAAFIIVATIPTAIFGFLFKDFLESLFDNIIYTALGFIITAAWILLSAYPKEKKKDLDYMHAFLIGCAQAVSIVPSISRSGATIATGLMLGVKREETAKFSFMISIPAIIGAAILTLGDITVIPDAAPMVFGTIAAAVSGYLSLRFLMAIIKKDQFRNFAWYCIIIGILTFGIYFFKL